MRVQAVGKLSARERIAPKPLWKTERSASSSDLSGALSVLHGAARASEATPVSPGSAHALAHELRLPSLIAIHRRQHRDVMFELSARIAAPVNRSAKVLMTVGVGSAHGTVARLPAVADARRVNCVQPVSRHAAAGINPDRHPSARRLRRMATPLAPRRASASVPDALPAGVSQQGVLRLYRQHVPGR